MQEAMHVKSCHAAFVKKGKLGGEKSYAQKGNKCQLK